MRVNVRTCKHTLKLYESVTPHDNEVLSRWNTGKGAGVTSHSPPPMVGLSYTFVPLTSPRVSVCVCMSVRIYCIQTTGSFSVAPPSV